MRGLRTALLAMALFAGAPAMTPEQVEELLSHLQTPAVAEVLPGQNSEGEALKAHLAQSVLKLE